MIQHSGLPRYIAGYWGKARPDAFSAFSVHPKAYHSLDVAACAATLLALRPSWMQALRHALPRADDAAIISLVVRLAAVHDLGKFGFQGVSDDACRALGREPPPPPPKKREWRHDNIGLVMLCAERGSGPFAFGQGLLDAVLGQRCRAGLDRFLASASACHHGRPTEGHIDPTQVIAGDIRRDAEEFIRDVVALPETATLPALPSRESEARRLSLVLSAIITTADWLGSSQRDFPYTEPRHDLQAYWLIAKRRARRAVARAGLHEKRKARSRLGFAKLFPGFVANPLQRLLDALPVADGPSLTIIEAPTGIGKTEAAITASAKLFGAGASGLLFTLPTTATADQQAARQRELRRRLFWLRSFPRMLSIHSGRTAGAVYDDDAEFKRAFWMAQGRCGLFADIAVSTVDQALLAVLPSKFSSVRLAGMLGKVLVIDEVHAYDAYTAEIVRALVETQGALGGHVILLSATMTDELKARLAATFARGLGGPAITTADVAHPAFPLVTRVTTGGVEHLPVKVAWTEAPKPVRLVHDYASCEQVALAAARAGKCVVWYRATVAQAIETARSLRSRWPDVQCAHSRFPETDRRRVFGEVERRFGPGSDSGTRRGGIVVATTILGLSLDLDFDVVICDLMPMDTMLQALGRQRRHSRDAFGNRIDGPDGRASDPMVVLSPDPDGEVRPDWYSSLLGDAAYAFRDPGILWRTAKVLKDAGEVHPTTVRGLVQAAFDDAVSFPGALDAANGRALGETISARSLARAEVMRCGLQTGYVHEGEVWPESRVPTRLGESVEVVVAVDDGGDVLRPYGGSSWEDARLTVSVRKASHLTLLDADEVAGLVVADDRIAPWQRVLVLHPVGGDLVGPNAVLTTDFGLEVA